jgi:hypothetical protein
MTVAHIPPPPVRSWVARAAWNLTAISLVAGFSLIPANAATGNGATRGVGSIDAGGVTVDLTEDVVSVSLGDEFADLEAFDAGPASDPQAASVSTSVKTETLRILAITLPDRGTSMRATSIHPAPCCASLDGTLHPP